MKLLTTRTRLAAAIGLAALVTLLVAGPASATTKNVTIVNLSFGPAVNINVGDSVQWRNGEAAGSGIFHTVTQGTSGAGTWGSALLSPGGTFTHQFTAVGSFAYHCNVHSFMSGTVNVSALPTTTTTVVHVTTTTPGTVTTTATTKPATTGTTTATTAAVAGTTLAHTGPGHVTFLIGLAAGLLLVGLFTIAVGRRRRLQGD